MHPVARLSTSRTVYSLDRTLSAALGRPLGIRDEDIDADLPLEIDSATLERLAQGHSPVSAQLRTWCAGFLSSKLKNAC